MVTLFSLLQHVQVLLEFLGLFPGCAVDAREHLVVLIAAPVGPGDRHQFDGSRVDLLRVFHMRSPAQIHERIVFVDRDFGLHIQRLSVLVQAALFQPIDQFQLVGLFLEDFAGFFRRQYFFLETVVSSNDLSHTFFELGQVVLRDGLGQIEIVVEPVFHGRSDRVLGLRELFQNGLRHDVRRRVANFIEVRLLVFFFSLFCHFRFLS